MKTSWTWGVEIAGTLALYLPTNNLIYRFSGGIPVDEKWLRTNVILVLLLQQDIKWQQVEAWGRFQGHSHKYQGCEAFTQLYRWVSINPK